MAKKLTKTQSAALGWLILLGLAVGGISKAVQAMGSAVSALVVVAVFGFYFWYKKKKRGDRQEYLMTKYRDEILVSKIMGGHFWEGQTSEQLADAIGQPIEVDEKQLKTKRTEIWKYDSQGRNRFGLRITIENGVVVGWDKKAS